MAPREHDVVQAAAPRVDTELGGVGGVIGVLVLLEGLGTEDDAIIEGTADGEGVADNIPLALGIMEEEKLAKVVDETD